MTEAKANPMTPTQYAEPFDGFVEPARRRPAIWRVIVGMLLVLIAFVGGVLLLLGVLIFIDPSNRLSNGIDYGTTPFGVVASLGVSGGAMLGLWGAVRFLHRRRLRTVVGDGAVMRQFGVGAAVAGGALLVGLGVWLLFFDLVPKVPPHVFLMWFPILIIILILQTGAEEMLFRGYLMQQLAARFSNPVLWFLLPQLIFVAIHYDPVPITTSIWPALFLIFMLSLICADLTRLTGNIGAAWGWHFANNLIALSFMGKPGDLDGLSLYVRGPTISTLGYLGIVPFIVSNIVAWLILRRVLR
jgi:membrane protease YdiL (CAAX protease family)